MDSSSSMAWMCPIRTSYVSYSAAAILRSMPSARKPLPPRSVPAADALGPLPAPAPMVATAATAPAASAGLRSPPGESSSADSRWSEPNDENDGRERSRGRPSSPPSPYASSLELPPVMNVMRPMSSAPTSPPPPPDGTMRRGARTSSATCKRRGWRRIRYSERYASCAARSLRCGERKKSSSSSRSTRSHTISVGVGTCATHA